MYCLKKDSKKIFLKFRFISSWEIVSTASTAPLSSSLPSASLVTKAIILSPFKNSFDLAESNYVYIFTL